MTGEAIRRRKRLADEIDGVHNIGKLSAKGGQFDLVHDLSWYGLTERRFGIEGRHGIGYRGD